MCNNSNFVDENVFFVDVVSDSIGSPISNSRREIGNSQLNKHMERPARELFIWALLAQRVAMAELFWGAEREGIAAALFAAMLCREMSQRCDDLVNREEMDEVAQ